MRLPQFYFLIMNSNCPSRSYKFRLKNETFVPQVRDIPYILFINNNIMQIDSSISLKSCRDWPDEDNDIFKSLIDDSFEGDSLNKNQCTVQNQNDLQLSKAFDSSQLNKSSYKSGNSDSSNSEKQLSEVPLVIKRQYSKQFHNRLEQLLQRNRPKRNIEKQRCSLDTSAALIKLMSQKQGVKQLFNIYILLNILLRASYLALTFYQFSTVSEDLRLPFWTLGGWIFARIMFIFTVIKLLNIGETTRDKKIKIVYDTYVQWFDDINMKIRQLERESGSIIRRTQEDEDQFIKQSQEIRRLQKWVLRIKTYIVLIPPELSFFFLKKQSNGFFQVQNLIIKSLEVFFYMPIFLYFLKSQTKDKSIIFFDFTNHDVQNVFSIMIVFDIALFAVVNTYLIYYGNKKYKIRPQK